MGKEPMYLVPVGTRMTHYIYCGKCFNELLLKLGIAQDLDFSNLFTHLSDNYLEGAK